MNNTTLSPTSRECNVCGFNSKELLDKHHVDWTIVNGRPKSDKKSKVIYLCKNCHFLLHNTKYLFFKMTKRQLERYILNIQFSPIPDKHKVYMIDGLIDNYNFRFLAEKLTDLELLKLQTAGRQYQGAVYK